MIDGVKIDVPNLDGNEWLENPLLEFHVYANTRTGELSNKLVAKYRGLKFILRESGKCSGVYHCSIEGSLHKYFNRGRNNATDFHIGQLQSVILEIHGKFDVDPQLAVLRNLGVGVNITVPLSAREFISNLVACGNRAFSEFSINRIKLGKAIGRQQYVLKIYDKGKQSGLRVKNLIRVEVAIKKMAYIKKYNIVKLSDLLYVDKIRPLGFIVHQLWGDVIYFDKQLVWKSLSHFQQKKVLYYAAPRNWEDFNRMQRMRAKRHFHKLCLSSVFKKIGLLLANKWEFLTAEKRIRFNLQYNYDDNDKLYTIYPLECTVNSGNNVQNEIVGKNPSSRYCKLCGNSLRQKRKDALYCSKKCNNKYHSNFKKKNIL